jgi:hypothetical protein
MPLHARLASAGQPLHLPWVMCSLRADPKEDATISSAELMFGALLTLLGEILNTHQS